MTRDQNVADLHRAIGEFVVAFEHFCEQMHDAIMFMLSKKGLSDQQVSRLLLAGLTAEPLRDLLGALIGEIRKPTGVEQAVVKCILKDAQKLISERNDVVHATWYVGYSETQYDDCTVATGHKAKRNGKGASVKFMERKSEDFDSLTSEARRLAKLITVLSSCYVFDHDIASNFSVSDGVVTTSVQVAEF